MSDHFKCRSHFSNPRILLKAVSPRRHLCTRTGHLWTVTIFNRKVSCYTTKCISLKQKYSIKGKYVCDKHMWSYDSIRHCLTVQKRLHSTSDSSALVTLQPDKFMPKIVVTIQWPLPETAGCGNFKTLSVRSVTAVSSIFGKQNAQRVSCIYRNLMLQPSGSISWFTPKKYFALFFVANFSSTKLAQVAG
jgi:hypothetical protein